jgi:hypothetical protein
VLFSPVYIESRPRRSPHSNVRTCQRLNPQFGFRAGLRDIPTRSDCKSFSLYVFADPHPLTALASIFYKNIGGGGHPRSSHRSPLSPIFRAHFQVPYPVSPAVATLTKTAGVRINNSHSGTRHSALTTLRNSFRFILLRTLLRLRKTQLVCFHAISHSSPKTTRGGGILPFHYRLSIEDPDPVRTVNLFPWLSPFASPNRSARIRVETL